MVGIARSKVILLINRWNEEGSTSSLVGTAVEIVDQKVVFVSIGGIHGLVVPSVKCVTLASFRNFFSAGCSGQFYMSQEEVLRP